jgi:multisubunit Na+/H+ antiporter MnhF subunit
MTSPDPVAQLLMVAALLGLAVAAAIAAPLVSSRRGGLAERVALLQLLAAKVVAACLGVAAAFGQGALIDAGLVLALLGAVGAAVFAQGISQ